MKTLAIAALFALSASTSFAQIVQIKKCSPHACCTNGNCFVSPQAIPALDAAALVSVDSVNDGLAPIWRHPSVASRDPFCHEFPLGCGG